MDLAQASYCEEVPPWTYDRIRADRLREHLRHILTDLISWRPT
jgi:formiminoglutamase